MLGRVCGLVLGQVGQWERELGRDVGWFYACWLGGLGVVVSGGQDSSCAIFGHFGRTHTL